MFRGFGFLGASAACVLLFVLLTSGPGAAKPSFAQVIESVKELTSVQYLQVGIGTKKEIRVDSAPSPTPVSRDAIRQRMSEIRKELASEDLEGQKEGELKSELKLLNAFLEDGSPPLVSLAWCRVIAPNKMRSEVSLPYRAVSIQSEENAITIDDVNRKATLQRSTILDQNGNEVRGRSFDFFSLIRVPEQGIRELPAREMDGKSVIGYERTTDQRGSTQTWWVDKETNLPIVVTVTNCFVKGVVSSEMEFRNITYNADIALKLFDTEAPDGYEVSEQHSTFSFELDAEDGK